MSNLASTTPPAGGFPEGLISSVGAPGQQPTTPLPGAESTRSSPFQPPTDAPRPPENGAPSSLTAASTSLKPVSSSPTASPNGPVTAGSGYNSSSNGNSTTSAGPRSSSPKSNDISPGAAAGIGIGCAIAGALIAAAIFVLFFRRRRRRAPPRSDAIPLNGFGSVEKTIASPDSVSPVAMIERSLPQPVEDQALGGELSRLKTAIKNHVQSYYHTNSVRGGVDQVALGLIATGNMPLIASTLGSLLSNPVTTMTAVRFCITWTVVSRIDPNCEPSLSFLPPEIASCLLSINSTRDDPSTKPGFMSRWKAFTAALLHDRYGSSTVTVSDARNRNISEALQALNAVLSPFADEQRDDRERVQKLEEILKRGARFGFTLFSQPSQLDFDWNAPPSAGRGTLVISPALTQVADDSGQRLPRPRVLEEQEVARGLETYL
ncbi:MAG: hypothetical protein L6R36_003761 [Xanthoria steineri]|nr:MAG: hypothetical protein L6R36_003761 [Xanthoria steineri]